MKNQNLPDLTNVGPIKIEYNINDKLSVGKAQNFDCWVIIYNHNDKPACPFVSDEPPVINEGKVIGMFNKYEQIQNIEDL